MGTRSRKSGGAHEREPVSLSELIHQYVRIAIETAVHEELLPLGIRLPSGPGAFPRPTPFDRVIEPSRPAPRERRDGSVRVAETGTAGALAERDQ